jgi:hypothetical protein
VSGFSTQTKHLLLHLNPWADPTATAVTLADLADGGGTTHFGGSTKPSAHFVQ